MSKKVLVIGGFGFIGLHISNVLSLNNVDVTIAHRSNLPSATSNFETVQLDLSNMSIDAVQTIVQEFDIILFCGGADDRKIPIGDAHSFYYKENVVPCLKLVKASIKTQVKQIIILGSYLSHFDRLNPTWRLKEKHPYIMSRYLQQLEPLELAKIELKVSTVEIPYVFGAASGKIPLWKPLIDYINRMPLIFYTKGGTNIMSVEQVAKAVYGVINSTTYRPHWIIGSENVSWTQLIQMISKALGKKRPVILIPNFIVRGLSALVKVYFKLSKKQTGLDLYHYIDVQTSNTFLDVDESMSLLDYEKVSMQESINDTVKASGYS